MSCVRLSVCVCDFSEKGPLRVRPRGGYPAKCETASARARTQARAWSTGVSALAPTLACGRAPMREYAHARTLVTHRRGARAHLRPNWAPTMWGTLSNHLWFFLREAGIRTFQMVNRLFIISGRFWVYAICYNHKGNTRRWKPVQSLFRIHDRLKHLSLSLPIPYIVYVLRTEYIYALDYWVDF